MGTLAQLLVRLRAERGWSQRELADAVPVSVDTIAKVEQERGRWSKQRAFRILTALGRALPMTAADALEFMRLTSLVDRRTKEIPAAMLARLIEQGTIAPSGATPPQVRTPTIRQQLHALVDEIADAHGAAAVMEAVKSIAILARVRAYTPPQTPPHPEQIPHETGHTPATQPTATDAGPNAPPTRRRLVHQTQGVTDTGIPYVDERYEYIPDDPPDQQRATG